MYNSFPSKAVHCIDSLLRSMHMGHQFLLNHFSCRRRLNLRADTGTKGCSTLLPIHTFASLLFPLFSKSNKCLYHFNSTRYQRLFHLAGIRFPRFYTLRQPPAPLSRQPAAAPQMPSFSLLFRPALRPPFPAHAKRDTAPHSTNSGVLSFRPHAGICLGNLCIYCIYICIIYRFLRHINPLKSIFYGR